MRKNYRLTQTQLGDLVGLSDKTVRDIERGTGSPSLKAVLSTLSALGLRLEVTDS
ncbi:helix-turn-helix domain-containing protein [Schaalia hyovaginalis]|nr:helix-turn-helix domain-containing protein [Schaalia hyovaginalis]